jgi:CheY-like chemotaxis protein
MLRVRIVHWKPEEAGPLVEACRRGGMEADYDAEAPSGPTVCRAIRQNPPDAVVIDLSRLPSHGREIAVWMRSIKATRHIPIVFANGEPAKVGNMRALLPDATFTTTASVRKAVAAACRKRAAEPVQPAPMMERYGARTAAEKMGIKAGATAAVIDPPRDYPAVIGELPENASLVENPDSVESVTLWFVHEPAGLHAGLRRMRAIADRTKLWILWRKGSDNGITQNGVRQAGIDVGLVDYKICSVDGRWSGILFARKKASQKKK